jgi:hypothetical protein
MRKVPADAIPFSSLQRVVFFEACSIHTKYNFNTFGPQKGDYEFGFRVFFAALFFSVICRRRQIVWGQESQISRS